MILKETPIAGCYVLEPEFIRDNRGFFARMYDENEWREKGLTPMGIQHNSSMSVKKGTVRGFHWQIAPHEQARAVRCTKGAVFDVCVDLRKDSPTYGKWVATELTEENHFLFYIPEGCAHGFQTLTDNAETFYPLSYPYVKEAEVGLRYDDPTIGVEWPLEVTELSEKDKGLPFLEALGK